MLRLALILALLVAIGGLVVSQFVTKPKVDDLNIQLTCCTQIWESASLDFGQSAGGVRLKAGEDQAGCQGRAGLDRETIRPRL